MFCDVGVERFKLLLLLTDGVVMFGLVGDVGVSDVELLSLLRVIVDVDC